MQVRRRMDFVVGKQSEDRLAHERDHESLEALSRCGHQHMLTKHDAGRPLIDKTAGHAPSLVTPRWLANSLLASPIRRPRGLFTRMRAAPRVSGGPPLTPTPDASEEGAPN